MSSSVCYSYFRPVIDKTQPICYAVIPLWFLILIFLFDCTIVTKENLHLKNNSKLTTMTVWNKNENWSLMNLLNNAQWLTCNWDMNLGYDMKSLAFSFWFTSFSRVLPTSQVGYRAGKPIESVVYCFYKTTLSFLSVCWHNKP